VCVCAVVESRLLLHKETSPAFFTAIVSGAGAVEALSTWLDPRMYDHCVAIPYSSSVLLCGFKFARPRGATILPGRLCLHLLVPAVLSETVAVTAGAVFSLLFGRLPGR